ncbi:MAG TPA: thermonuclease family protein [Gammaproteobacteria bacterium]
MRIHPRLSWPVLAALALWAEAACVPQERFSGHAKVTDGDSLEIGSTRVRLYGVDAPEGRQSCTRNGRDWACGNEAARELRSLIGDRAVTCTKRDVDSYGRIVAVCRNGATDLNAEMVRSGFATAYRRYSSDYVDEENEAHAARRGIWAGEFENPEDYRHDAPAEPRNDRPPVRGCDGCYIKGNINSQGERIYHVPGSSSYDDTVIDESKGERWFRTESEARAAGWRPPRS